MNIILLTVFFFVTLYLPLDVCESTDSHCPVFCESCNGVGSNLVCYCKSGEFYFNDACAQCRIVGINCTSCSNVSRCEECDIGKWGLRCYQDCGAGCKDGICNSLDGSCTCIQGYTGYDCKSQCSSYCLGNTCLNNGHCNCTSGYYLPMCTAKCYSACKECTNSSSCSLCPSGKFGQFCDKSCDIMIKDCIDMNCPQACTSCVDSEHCNGCNVGRFGSTCNNKCSANCFGGCIQSSGVCNACPRGYYGSNCEQACNYCGESDCTQNGECNNCYPGYYGTFCNLTCSSTCSANCNQTDGSCTLTCPSNCIRCSDKTACTKCKDGYYGHYCSSACSTTCEEGKCDIQSGRCMECSSSSYYGDFCNTTCSSACSTNGCERQTGSCFGCIPNYYGSTCENVCSENCANSTTESKCDSKGKCISGCIDGFTGDTCTTGRSQQTEETNSGSVIGGAVGGVLGVCAVVALVVVVLVLKKKGILWKESKKTYEDITPERSKDEPYTTLAAASTTEYELPDSEPRSELTIEGEDNGVYYNDERAYYKNVGGNVHKT
ncbi:multiple epidermal growth factor-like domains protein 10 isoform X2 [Mya arenaria]|uniref:multiple epidermal growth factor-like domains protein 10 isoform X2 n=1 Tax=Mya arenaria TaxID=6604 RepID=UPI0022E69D97|nr:multiple epidermal growth factor-like domains protein 10 isoform X2 [Mya arenaria]